MNRAARSDVNGELQTARKLLRAEPTAHRFIGMSTAEIVACCAKTYGDEVARLTLHGELDTTEVKAKASALWSAALPDPIDNPSTVAYIACVAWGARMRLLTPQETKAMMFLAQTQLSVLRLSEPKPAKPQPNPEPDGQGRMFDAKAMRLPQKGMEP